MSETPDDSSGDGVRPDFELTWPHPQFSLKLRQPIVTGSEETITHLHLREPVAVEFETIMAAEPAVRRRKSVSMISSVPMRDIAKIGIGDVTRAEAYLTTFADVGELIGGWDEQDGWPEPNWSCPLRAPLRIGDNQIEALSLREPTMDEFERIRAWPASTSRRMGVALVAGLEMEDLGQALIGDLMRAEAYVSSFFGRGQVIGIGLERS